MDKVMKRRVLSDLFPVRTPHDLLAEVLDGVSLTGPGNCGGLVAQVYKMTLGLYRGEWKNYLACDTRYHDVRHAAETFLAMGRLIHGAMLEGVKLTARETARGLTAAILHDTGYLRTDKEKECPGARFRAMHEQRSMAFMTRHGGQLGLSADDIVDCRSMIQCTIMTEEIAAIKFRTASAALLGRMLAAADLMSQISSSTYLENLVDLFDEDQSADHPRCADIRDCLFKAIGFDAFAREHLQAILPASDSYLKAHFQARWKNPHNLYTLAIERQKQRLAALLQQSDFEPQRHLRRWGSLEATCRVFESPIHLFKKAVHF